MANIGETCDRACSYLKQAQIKQSQVVDYCNEYAGKLLGDYTFKFDELPDTIVEAVIYGEGLPKHASTWTRFLKDEVRKALKLD